MGFLQVLVITIIVVVAVVMVRVIKINFTHVVLQCVETTLQMSVSVRYTLPSLFYFFTSPLYRLSIINLSFIHSFTQHSSLSYFLIDNLIVFPCGHVVCRLCLGDKLESDLKDGVTGVGARCPGMGCSKEDCNHQGTMNP